MRFLDIVPVSGICLCALALGSYALPAMAEQATISVVHKNNGADDYFVARRGSKVLWKYDSWGPIFRDRQSGISVIESSQLLVVDPSGQVRIRLNFHAAHSPRSVFLSRGYLVYDTGDLAISAYDPGTE